MLSPILALLILIVLSYVTGSFPTSIIMGKLLRGIDIREHGSGNAGGTNVFRVLGWKPGIAVVVVDIFKGWVPVAIYATRIFPDPPIGDVGVLQILLGFAAVLGHTYTIFAGFRGGKGVGTLAGMLLGLFPVAFPLCLAVFAVVLFSTGYVSASSMSAAVALPIFLLGLPPLIAIQSPTLSLLIFSLLIPWFVIYTHRSNISRLRAGTENRFEKVMIFRKKKEK